MPPILYILIGIVLAIYLLTIVLRGNRSFGVQITNWLRIAQLILLLGLVGIYILSRYNTYLSGFWTPKIIFWTWFFIVMLLFGLGKKTAMFKAERIFYKIIYFIPVAWIPLMIVPILPLAVGFWLYPILVGDQSMVLYSSEKIRVEQLRDRFLGPDPPVDVYIKDKVFSHKVATVPIQFNKMYDSLVVIETPNDSLLVTYYKRQGYVEDGTRTKFTVLLRPGSASPTDNVFEEPINLDTTYATTTQILRSRTIPDSVFRMTRLRHLFVTGMDCDYGDQSNCWGIEHISFAISRLGDLRTLRLPVNAIQRIPDELAELKNLTLIDLSDNPGVGNIGAIVQVRSLEYLYLFGCGLTKLPPDIGKLTQLKELGLKGNNIDQAELQRIQKALPLCKIIF